MPPITDTADDLWVFGYGSLMWRPGFPFLERREARLIGAHRALCVYSFVHRGTPEKPGLVLGLDQGGTCRGIAYRVAAAARNDTIAYLRAREQVTMVYRETFRSVWLQGDTQARDRAEWKPVGRPDQAPNHKVRARSEAKPFADRARVSALCYVADRGHPQYAGKLSLEQQLHLVRQGHGIGGPNRDYVIEAVKSLEALGYRESALHLLLERLLAPAL